MSYRIYFVLLFIFVAVIGENHFCAAKSPLLVWHEGSLDLSQFAAPRFHDNRSQHLLVQFDRPLQPSDREKMEETGVRFLYYVPRNTYFVTGPIDALQGLLYRPAVKGMAVVPGEMKLDASLRIKAERQSRIRNAVPHNADMETVKILFFDDISFERAKRILLAHGAVLEPDRTGFDFRQTLDTVTLPSTNLNALANEDAVFLIAEPDPPDRPCNINAQDTSNVDEIHPDGLSGYDLDGTGVTVGMWDSGTPRLTHEQLSGRASQQDRATDISFHSSHVAGTIAGSGAGNANAQGMAPNATLLCWNIHNDLIELDENAHRIVASNHSYASSAGWEYDLAADRWHWYGQPELDPYRSHLFGAYTTQSQLFDRIVQDYNLSMVVAAGNNRGDGAPPPGTLHIVNDGPERSTNERLNDGWFEGGFETIVPNGVGKNVITVGAIDDRTDEPPVADDRSLTSFSSWGPTGDGRIKPDLVANGVKLTSMSNTADDAYATLSGTSTATPVVTGTIACLVQQFRILFAGADPSAATMKGILIHSARDGGSAIGPDYRFGWGLLDARASADFIKNHDSGGNRLETGVYTETSLEYPAVYYGQGPIQVTLIWTDPPGAPISENHSTRSNLVNDLDLSIIGPDKQHYPWTLDPENPALSAKQDRENHRDNVEQVTIPSPMPGRYTIHIKGQVNMGNAQNYTLCITGLRMEDESPHVNILSPFNEGILSGQETIRIYASYRENIARIAVKLDGDVIDDLLTPDTIEGDLTLDPPQRRTVQTIEWDTRDFSNGLHTLEIEVTGGDGETRILQRNVTIYNEEETTPLTSDGIVVAGKLAYSTKENWYSIQVPESATYTIETHTLVKQPLLDTIVNLYASNRQTRLASDDDSGLETLSKMTHYFEKNQTYYVQLISHSISIGWFGISLKPADLYVPPIVTPVIVNGPVVNGHIADVGDVHWYSFETHFLGTHFISIIPPPDPSSVSISFVLYNENDLDDPIRQSMNNNNLHSVLHPNQRYFLAVSSTSKSTGHYSFQINEYVRQKPTELFLNSPPVTKTFVSDEKLEFWFFFVPEESGNFLFEFDSTEPDFLQTLEIRDLKAGGLSYNRYPPYPLETQWWYHYFSSSSNYLVVNSSKGSGSFSLRIHSAETDDLITVKRSLDPTEYVPDEPINVRLDIVRKMENTWITIQETIPTGWTLDESSLINGLFIDKFFWAYHNGHWINISPFNPMIKEIGTYQLNFSIIPPENAEGDHKIIGFGTSNFYDLTGAASVSGSCRFTITGDSQLIEKETVDIEHWSIY